ncbi:MAG: universal stress protein [Longimicrobiaceae bacterium]
MIKILFASRLESPSGEAARVAARLAEHTGGTVVLLYVAGELETVASVAASAGVDEESVRADIIAEVEERMQEFAGRNFAGREVQIEIGEGGVVDEIVRAASEAAADYLVVGTEVHSTIRQLVIGSTTHGILDRSPCPVLVVHTRRKKK